MKKFWSKYKHGLPVLIYAAIYLTWFFLLESRVPSSYTIIHTKLDNKIPFCEYFVIPYYIWFLYVFVAVGIAFFKDKEAYDKSLVFLMTGMTVFLLVSTFFPNGHNLRPRNLTEDNMCLRLVKAIYRADTPTNLWPSIHVYNSIGCHLCILNIKNLKHKGAVRNLSLLISVSIILSTMFIKQHSTFDVFTAFLMAGLMAILVYRQELQTYFREHPAFSINYEKRPAKTQRYI